jgi:hypothetical protein
VPSREIWAALGTAARFLSPAAGEAEWSGLSRRQQYQCAQDGPLRDLRLERVRVAVRQASPDGMSGARSTMVAHYLRGPGRRAAGLIIRLIIQTIRQDPSRSVWIDEASNLSRPDPSGADQIDVEHQATDLVVSAGCVRWVSDAGQRGSRPTGRPPAPT